MLSWHHYADSAHGLQDFKLDLSLCKVCIINTGPEKPLIQLDIPNADDLYEHVMDTSKQTKH